MEALAKAFPAPDLCSLKRYTSQIQDTNPRLQIRVHPLEAYRERQIIFDIYYSIT